MKSSRDKAELTLVFLEKVFEDIKGSPLTVEERQELCVDALKTPPVILRILSFIAAQEEDEKTHASS